MKTLILGLTLLSSILAVANESTLYMTYYPGVRTASATSNLPPVDNTKNFKVELPQLEEDDSFYCTFYGYAKENGVRIDEDENSDEEYNDTVTFQVENSDDSSKYDELRILSMLEVPARFNRVQLEPLFSSTYLVKNSTSNLFLYSGIFSIDQSRTAGTHSTLSVGSMDTIYLANASKLKRQGINSAQDVNFIKLKATDVNSEDLSYNYEFNDVIDTTITYGVDVKCSHDN